MTTTSYGIGTGFGRTFTATGDYKSARRAMAATLRAARAAGYRIEADREFAAWMLVNGAAIVGRVYMGQAGRWSRRLSGQTID